MLGLRPVTMYLSLRMKEQFQIHAKGIMTTSTPEFFQNCFPQILSFFGGDVDQVVNYRKHALTKYLSSHTSLDLVILTRL